MHRENFFVNDGCDRQAVKAVGKSFPQFDVVPAFTWEDNGEKVTQTTDLGDAHSS